MNEENVNVGLGQNAGDSVEKPKYYDESGVGNNRMEPMDDNAMNDVSGGYYNEDCGHKKRDSYTTYFKDANGNYTIPADVVEYTGTDYCGKCQKLIQDGLFFSVTIHYPDVPVVTTYCFNCLQASSSGSSGS